MRRGRPRNTPFACEAALGSEIERQRDLVHVETGISREPPISWAALRSALLKGQQPSMEQLHPWEFGGQWEGFLVGEALRRDTISLLESADPTIRRTKI